MWPHHRFAEACAIGAWAREPARPIDIDDWVEAWLPKLTEEGFRVAVFQTPQDEATDISPQRLKKDLERDLPLPARRGPHVDATVLMVRFGGSL